MLSQLRGSDDAHREAGPDEQRPPPLVFVVEDDAGVRTLIDEVLRAEGLNVQTANDGWHALGWIVQQRPALVVLDMGLPTLDGKDVAYGLRTAHQADIPILLVTGDPRAAERAAEVGAFAYLRKPFGVDELIAAVRRGLGDG